MKIDQLIYFNETAKLQHIGKASKILGISTSAISHSIASLEAELGYDLFEKKGKNIVLTDQGRNLLNQSQDLINQFQCLKQNLLGSHQERLNFKIAASHLLAHEILAPAWAQLAPSFPNATVEILTYRSADVVRAVLNREIDFGICFSPQENPELEIVELYKGDLVISVRNDHPILEENENRRMPLISDYPAVLPKAFQGIDLCLSHLMFDKHGIIPRVKTLTDSYDVSLELIKRSDCWGFTPDLLIEKNRKAEFSTIKPIQGWIAPYNISIIHLKKRFVSNFFHDL